MHKTIFPKGGTIEGFTIVPSEDEITKGTAGGGIELPMPSEGKYPTLNKTIKAITDALGFIAPTYQKKTTPPPRAAGPYGFGFDSKDSMAYKELAMEADAAYDADIAKKGYVRKARNTDGMLDLGDKRGYEKGSVVYHNTGLMGLERYKVLSHEALAKALREKTGRDHNDLHDVVRSLEVPMAVAYMAGRTGVLDEYTEKALRALEN